MAVSGAILSALVPLPRKKARTLPSACMRAHASRSVSGWTDSSTCRSILTRSMGAVAVRLTTPARPEKGWLVVVGGVGGGEGREGEKKGGRGA